MRNINLASVGTILLQNWLVSSYNEDTKEQMDYFLNAHHCDTGELAYLYSHESKKYTKLEIVRCIWRSHDIAYYDGRGDCVLTDMESVLNADTSAEFITDNDSCLVWFRYGTEFTTDFDLLLSTIRFDEFYDDAISGERTYYYTAPKELLQIFPMCNQYPEAVSAELSIEIPLKHLDDPEYAIVSLSPTREVDGGTEDCDWCEIDFLASDVSYLMSLADECNAIRFAVVEHADGFGDSIVFWCEVNSVPSTFISEAMDIDGGNFSPDCFGVCVVLTEDGLHICEDAPGYELYYVSNSGEKYWMNRTLSDGEKKDMIAGCLEFLGNLV